MHSLHRSIQSPCSPSQASRALARDCRAARRARRSAPQLTLTLAALLVPAQVRESLRRASDVPASVRRGPESHGAYRLPKRSRARQRGRGQKHERPCCARVHDRKRLPRNDGESRHRDPAAQMQRLDGRRRKMYSGVSDGRGTTGDGEDARCTGNERGRSGRQLDLEGAGGASGDAKERGRAAAGVRCGRD